MSDLLLEKIFPTLDGLLAMGEDAHVEIIDGAIKEMAAAGGIHHIIIMNFIRPLDRYVQSNDMGSVFSDGLTYLMWSPAGRLKDSFVPDLSFVRSKNIPSNWDIEKPHPGVPDLAVEVVSPGDDAEDLQTKRKTYLEKGTEQVWIAYPRLREVHQYTREGYHVYSGSHTIDAEALFPNIEGLTLDAIFALPKWAVKD